MEDLVLLLGELLLDLGDKERESRNYTHTWEDKESRKYKKHLKDSEKKEDTQTRDMDLENSYIHRSRETEKRESTGICYIHRPGEHGDNWQVYTE